MMICFANVCFKNKFCKPVIIEDEDGAVPIIEVKGSFHPLMEKHDFIQNDFTFDKSIVAVITGPNYSGKSTILTQVGITVYLAQLDVLSPLRVGGFLFSRTY